MSGLNDSSSLRSPVILLPLTDSRSGKCLKNIGLMLKIELLQNTSAKSWFYNDSYYVFKIITYHLVDTYKIRRFIVALIDSKPKLI